MSACYRIKSGIPVFVSRHARHYENLYKGFFLSRIGYRLWWRWTFTRTIGRNGTEKAVQFLKENESIDSALGRYVWGQAIRFFNNLETNTEWQAFIEEHKNQWIRMVLEEWEGKLIDGDTLDWKRLMDIVIDRFNVLGTEILLNPDKQAPFERFFLLRSIPWLQKLNPLIDSVVGQELSRYSPDEITQIVRGKMYYDLQMVRINGSLIGAVLGGILYGLTIIVEEVLK